MKKYSYDFDGVEIYFHKTEINDATKTFKEMLEQKYPQNTWENMNIEEEMDYNNKVDSFNKLVKNSIKENLVDKMNSSCMKVVKEVTTKLEAKHKQIVKDYKKEIALLKANQTEKDKELAEIKVNQTEKNDEIDEIKVNQSENDKELAEIKANQTEKNDEIAEIKVNQTEKDKELAEIKANQSEKDKLLAEIKANQTEKDKELAEIKANQTEKDKELAELKEKLELFLNNQNIKN